MLFNLLLANTTILSCFFFLFLVVLNSFFTIPIEIENARQKLAPVIPTGAPMTVANDVIEIVPVVTDKTITRFMWSRKSGKKILFTQGVMESQGKSEFENFCIRSQEKSGKKVPVENEVCRSTFGFQNCFP